jgi:FKBP-type peptidyl-prolyl cis-trans isomerase
VASGILPLASTFQNQAHPHTGGKATRAIAQCQLSTDSNSNSNSNSNPALTSTRREWVTSSLFTTAALATALTSSNPSPAMAADAATVEALKGEGTGGGVTMFKTASGLKYIEMASSNDPSARTPRYGQLCVISYTAYIKLPNDKEKQKFDYAEGYVMKHGNGKMLPGIDEGIHTMRIGSTRRLIIPPKLGFVNSGLGPLPEYPWNRWILNKGLDSMVAQQSGNLIYDIQLKLAIDDEADQGYYEDESLSAGEYEMLQRKLKISPGQSEATAPEGINLG